MKGGRSSKIATKSGKGEGGSSQTVMSPLINSPEKFSWENTFDAPSQVLQYLRPLMRFRGTRDKTFFVCGSGGKWRVLRQLYIPKIYRACACDILTNSGPKCYILTDWVSLWLHHRATKGKSYVEQKTCITWSLTSLISVCIHKDMKMIGSGTNTKCAVKPIVISMGMKKNVGQTSQPGTKS